MIATDATLGASFDTTGITFEGFTTFLVDCDLPDSGSNACTLPHCVQLFMALNAEHGERKMECASPDPDPNPNPDQHGEERVECGMAHPPA